MTHFNEIWCAQFMAHFDQKIHPKSKWHILNVIGLIEPTLFTHFYQFTYDAIIHSWVKFNHYRVLKVLSEVVKLITASWSLLIDKYHIWNHTFFMITWSQFCPFLFTGRLMTMEGVGLFWPRSKWKIRFSSWPIPRSLTDFMILTINSPLNKWDNCLIFGPINRQKTTKYRQKLPTWVLTSNNCIVGWLLIVFRLL